MQDNVSVSILLWVIKVVQKVAGLRKKKKKWVNIRLVEVYLPPSCDCVWAELQSVEWPGGRL